MKRKYNEFYIGIIVAFTILLVLGSILLLEKNNFLQPGMIINLVVKDAQEIKTGGEVIYRGMDVGSVIDTKLTSKGVLLKLKITGTDSIPADSKFSIAALSLIGNKSVLIAPGSSKTYLKNGDYVSGNSSSNLTELLKSGSRLTNNINKVVKNVDTLTNQETRNKIKDALNNIDKSVTLLQRTIRSNMTDIRIIIKNMKKFISENKTPVDSIIERLSAHSGKLAAAMDNAERITENMNEIISRLKSGRGTAGKFLTDDKLYNKINNTVTSLDSLINDIKKHPGRYIHVSIF